MIRDIDDVILSKKEFKQLSKGVAFEQAYTPMVEIAVECADNLIKAQEKLDEADVLVNEAKEDVKIAKQESAQAEQMAFEAEQMAFEAEQMAFEAEQSLAQSEQSLAQSEQSLAQAKQETAQAKQETAQAEQMAFEAEQRAFEAEQRAFESEQRAFESEQRAFEAENKVTEAKVFQDEAILGYNKIADQINRFTSEKTEAERLKQKSDSTYCDAMADTLHRKNLNKDLLKLQVSCPGGNKEVLDIIGRAVNNEISENNRQIALNKQTVKKMQKESTKHTKKINSCDLNLELLMCEKAIVLQKIGEMVVNGGLKL